MATAQAPGYAPITFAGNGVGTIPNPSDVATGGERGMIGDGA